MTKRHPHLTVVDTARPTGTKRTTRTVTERTAPAPTARPTSTGTKGTKSGTGKDKRR